MIQTTSPMCRVSQQLLLCVSLTASANVFPIFFFLALYYYIYQRAEIISRNVHVCTLLKKVIYTEGVVLYEALIKVLAVKS